ncbi:MAG: DUF5723 family protein [Bacteroidales bacterium]|nr:DUF5723 family protein [Bacteroidales bacterium]
MKLKFKYSILYVFLLFSTVTGYAQHGYTMNFLSLLPQQNKYNPAYYVPYHTYIGLPGIQSQLNNDAFTIDRSFIEREGRKLLDINGIISGLSTENNIGFDFNLDLFSLGFKIGENNQFHMGLGVEAYYNTLLTKNTLSFFLTGNGGYMGLEGADALDGNYFDMNAYAALSLGYSREINQQISVGGRVKLLSGLANVYTERSKIHLFIDELDPNVTPYTHTIRPDITINQSLPENFDLTKNLGIGFDLGGVYEFNERISVGASINDIGFINWKNEVERITSRGQEEPFVYSGVSHLEDIFNENNFDMYKAVTSFLDSISDFLQLEKVDSTFSSYRSPLRTSYNLSGFYNITDKDQLGIMWNSQIGRRKNNVLTIAYTRMVGRNFQVCLNNAIINENAFNFGGGFAVNAGPLQLYFMVDKISSLQVIKMRAINLQLGLNLVISRTDKDPDKRRRIRSLTPRDGTGYVNDRWAW